MTVKLIALYQRPDDVDAFLDHYRQVHLPLIEKVPGLLRTIVNHTDKVLIGDTAPFLIAEMHFADPAAFDAAMASPENRAAGKDLMGFAKGLVTLIAAASTD
ncbi:EthD family reductase [Sphingomonas naphthae]|uniref:EthD family reductase n=1 Tax=Sphingomonas naphthae TaxID=1813468 RepID=A0ABY7THD6_9SPHN|nr:EthD family reductase [Sphingomonas naphthae]WCT72463.1 EthD family reductase [Sphingomonas naphthae]